MASTYSTNLALELIGTGDQAGTWGNTTNTNLGTLIEQAISGYVTQAVSTGTDTTITIPNGATGVARNMFIELTGTGGASTNLIVPSNKKLYFIYNNASGAVTVKVAGQTGVSVAVGAKVILVSNGTDIVEATTYLTAVPSSLTVTTLNATSASITTLTGTTLGYSSANITTVTGTTISATNMGAQATTQFQAASANITTVTGTNLSAASLTVSTGNLTFSGTAQRITGDMSNATIANRLTFQTSTANSNTTIMAIPNGTSPNSALNLFNAADPTNAGFGGILVGSTEVQLRAAITGTGSYLPMTFYTNGAEKVRLTTTGNFLVGTTTDVSGLSGVISDIAGNVRNIPSAGAAKTSAYTLTLTDIGEFVTVGSSGSITVPNDTFTAGNAISIYNDTTGNISINCPITTAYLAGTNTDRASLTLATRGIATILFINPSLCVASGNLT